MRARRSFVALAITFTFGAVTACGAADEPLETPVADAPPVTRGVLQRWPEAREHLLVDGADTPERATVSIGRARPTGLDAMWSIASTTKTSGTAFFYADFFRAAKESRVAVADAVRVSDIRDAARLSYAEESVGPVGVGAIVVVEHLPTRRYLALVLDAIEPTDPRTAGAGPYAYANVRWYLTAAGSADFGRADE